MPYHVINQNNAPAVSVYVGLSSFTYLIYFLGEITSIHVTLKHELVVIMS